MLANLNFAMVKLAIVGLSSKIVRTCVCFRVSIRMQSPKVFQIANSYSHLKNVRHARIQSELVCFMNNKIYRTLIVFCFVEIT